MNICNSNILNVYLNGSRVYGTNKKDSDYDFIVVVKENTYGSDHVRDENCDYSIVTKEEWDKQAKENSVDFCECYFLPKKFKIIENYVPEFEFKKENIRSSFSSVASNSWVKCKKKLTVEKDFAPYIGKKSLWHSLRILQFGIQILRDGKITDYSSANSLYNEIVGCDSNDWEYYKEKYQKTYNALKSEFRAYDKE